MSYRRQKTYFFKINVLAPVFRMVANTETQPSWCAALPHGTPFAVR
jgi:hypothetical protein